MSLRMKIAMMMIVMLLKRRGCGVRLSVHDDIRLTQSSVIWRLCIITAPSNYEEAEEEITGAHASPW
jgi:hypothetical protein